MLYTWGVNSRLYRPLRKFVATVAYASPTYIEIAVGSEWLFSSQLRTYAGWTDCLLWAGPQRSTTARIGLEMTSRYRSELACAQIKAWRSLSKTGSQQVAG